MKAPLRVAVLGAGIMGSATALLLARRGVPVRLIDAAPEPFQGASRWNEGKIHLGHLYAADPSLRTARRLLPGGLAFKPLVESLLGSPIDEAITAHDDTYLVHRHSVVDAEAMGNYLRAATALAREHPEAQHYLGDLRQAAVQRLDARQLDADYDTASVIAGYRVPERSVDTQWLADRFVQALAAEDRIEQRLSTRVTAVRRTAPELDSPLRVDTEHGSEGEFDIVVNALWEGRLAIDATMGLAPPVRRTHRYRVSAFVRTRSPIAIPSTVIATGPFGDVKCYSPTRFYLSWYASGLLAEGGDVAPPPTPRPAPADRERISADLLARLGQIIPAVNALPPLIEQLRLEGGWVYAVGEGSLADERSELHRRDRIGIQRSGGYVSVDTGKYSIAPWLAKEIADGIAAVR
ncbi:MAG: FAD-dependent oxidoreductase [Arenimonas sp.]|jgi:glycine/D-amino acid oxidase-like deaminating enzyme